MPDISDYQELSLVGMDIDDFAWAGGTLRTRFGGGYGASALVAPASGLHRWSISSGCLPGDAVYGALIEGKPRADYYFDFFREHTTGGREVFQFEFRGKKYHASFVNDGIEFQRHTEDLFSNGGVEIEQRRVMGITYYPDGSIFSPADLTEVWAWWTADLHTYAEDTYTWTDRSGNARPLVWTGPPTFDVVHEENVHRGMGVMRLNEDNDGVGVISSGYNPTVYEVFIALRINEETFSGDDGVISGGTANAILRGDNGTAKWDDLSLSGFTYRLNGETHAANDAPAPMEEFGVIHLSFASGQAITDLQFGRDRDQAAYAHVDIGEIIICNATTSASKLALLSTYMERKWLG